MNSLDHPTLAPTGSWILYAVTGPLVCTGRLQPRCWLSEPSSCQGDLSRARAPLRSTIKLRPSSHDEQIGPRVTRARDSATPPCGLAPPYILTQTMRGWRLGDRPETLRMLYRDLVPWTLNRLAFRHPDSREALGPPERPPVSASVVS